MQTSAQQPTFYRHKILLALLQAFGGKLGNVDLQKYLFLFTELCQSDKSYEFVPYKYGCFSFQSYADRTKLIEMGAISASQEHWQLAASVDYLSQLTQGDKQKLLNFHEHFAVMKGEVLVREVYTRFPYYAIRSEIAGKLLSAEQLQAVEQARPKAKGAAFYTIGYEGKSFEHYLNQLIRHEVKLLCDVRKNPLSRKYGFSKKTLSETLAKLDIEYVHLPELGIVSEKRQVLNTKQDYERLFAEYETTTLRQNDAALHKLFSLYKRYQRVAITCFEAESCMCHRGRVAKALQLLPEWPRVIEHI
jgi:uncharacterized protein (DUF488 family)